MGRGEDETLPAMKGEARSYAGRLRLVVPPHLRPGSRRRQTHGAGRADCLVLTASYGEGHRQAGQAVAEALQRLAPNLRVLVQDYVQLVRPYLNASVRWAYIQSVRHAPRLYRWFYDTTDRIPRSSRVHRWINSVGMEELHAYLEELRPAAVLSTYPTPAGVLSSLRTAGRLSVRNLVVITDFTVHNQWVHPEVDRYFVGAEAVAEQLVARGVPREKVVVSGIPIRMELGRLPPREEAARFLQLDPSLPTVVFMGGAYGLIGGFGKVVALLAHLPVAAQVVVVAGRSRHRAREARRAAAGAPRPVHVLGFVDRMETVYACADVLVTKAGGLTVSEALAAGVPMIIYRPIPGQESRNTEFLVAHRAARFAHAPEELEREVIHLLTHEEQRRALGEAARALGRPDAAMSVARETLALMSGGGSR